MKSKKMKDVQAEKASLPSEGVLVESSTDDRMDTEHDHNDMPSSTMISKKRKKRDEKKEFGVRNADLPPEGMLETLSTGDNLAVEDDCDKMQSFVMSNNEKRNKKRKKKKDAEAEGANLPLEGILKKELLGNKVAAGVNHGEMQSPLEGSNLAVEGECDKMQSFVVPVNKKKNKKMKKKKDEEVEGANVSPEGTLNEELLGHKVAAGVDHGEMQSCLVTDNKKKYKKKKDNHAKGTSIPSEGIPNKEMNKKANKSKIEKEAADMIDQSRTDNEKTYEKKKDDQAKGASIPSEGIPNQEMNKKPHKSKFEKVAADRINQSTTDNEKKYKKKKDGQAKGASFSSEGILNKEMTKRAHKSKIENATADRFDQNASGLNKEENSNTSSQPRKKKKSVTFSGHVEVFSSSNDSTHPKDQGETGLIHGKRYSAEEDEKIKEAVLSYIEKKDLGEEGLHKVFNLKSCPELRNCWKEIAECLPRRPHESVWYRASILFSGTGGKKHKWKPEELEAVKRHYEQHGRKWKEVADIIGRHRHHVKDAWRRTFRVPSATRGHWSQDEYQKLFDLVNLDLRMKVSEEKNNKHGMLRENISWEAISAKLSRFHPDCCMRWYDQLSSSMVAQGLWSDLDDYKLVDALSELDACCVEDVNWDNLLEHRSGEICHKRWKEMTKHIGGHREKSFMEQVELLSTRYRSDMRDYRAQTVSEAE